MLTVRIRTRWTTYADLHIRLRQARDSRLYGSRVRLSPSYLHHRTTAVVSLGCEEMDSKVLCGPLLRCVKVKIYDRITAHTVTVARYTHSDYEEGVWHGSVLLIVSNSSNRPPTLHLSPEHFPDKSASIPGHPLHSENGSDGGWTFWRFSLVIPLWEGDQRVDYEIKLFEQSSRCCNASFYVPAKEESMRILFHSCNGFSVSVNKNMYKEPSLWNDVLRSESLVWHSIRA